MLVNFLTLPEVVSQGLENLMRQIPTLKVSFFDYFNKKKFGLFTPLKAKPKNNPKTKGDVTNV